MGYYFLDILYFDPKKIVYYIIILSCSTLMFVWLMISKKESKIPDTVRAPSPLLWGVPGVPGVHMETCALSDSRGAG